MVAFPGVDPSWAAHVNVPSSAPIDPPGTVNRWHYLDNSGQLTGTPMGTLLCVHGNPTWSYLWRSLLAAGVVHGWRVIAVDQLEMGFSDRTGTFRRLADRVNDLEDFASAIGLSGPVVTVGHDWGGVVSLGYALRHRAHLAGVVLTNTAVHQDPGRPLPAPLRLALHPAVHRWGTRTSTAFLEVTHALARPKLAREVRAAYLAPYRRPSRRQGVADFVEDIPAGPAHPSFSVLAGIAEGIRGLDVPALLLWGPADPIFSDTYLEDLTRRIPHAQVHRFEGAGHLVAEDRDIAAPLFTWLEEFTAVDGGPMAAPALDGGRPVAEGSAGPDFSPLWSRLSDLALGDASHRVAVADMGADGVVASSLTWQELQRRVDRLAASLSFLGVTPGSRVSLMVPPGIDLTVLLYACLRIGAVIVVADAGLGVRGLSRAVKGSVPDFLVGIDRALAAAALFGWPGRRISVHPLSASRRRLLRVEHSLDELLRQSHPLPADAPGPDADAAVLFTSGSTGPAKGVVYTHRQLAAMRNTVAATFNISPGDGLVAGFAPFALLGPALGAASVTPAMDVTAPRTLSAQALADAVSAISATVVFASPAALRNVAATRDGLALSGAEALGTVSLLLSAGAPVPVALLDELQDLLPAASLHTPYGMTEALPVTDIDLAGIHAAAADASASAVQGAGNGVCVGRAVAGAHITVAPLGAPGNPVTEPGVTGEILVHAPHVKKSYFRLWQTERESSRTPGWHRTGDVGHLDAAGRLWVEGRLVHIISAPGAVVTPVGVEQAIEGLDDVALAAVVGVGPAGTQAVVAVIEPSPAVRRPAPAAPDAAARVRAAGRDAGVEISAVLLVPALPTDIRHNAKIDRGRVAGWAERVLAGGGMGGL